MISAHLRRTVRTLYAFACGYCGVTEAEVGAYLTIDHFVPQNVGGSDDMENLVYACHACNLYKSVAWNPQSPPVLHPLQTDMKLHIRSTIDDILEGLTPEGMRHIKTLHLNRPPMVERRKMRRLLQTLLVWESERLAHEKQLDAEVKVKTQMIRRKKKRKR
jgi:hypothetical protein